MNDFYEWPDLLILPTLERMHPEKYSTKWTQQLTIKNVGEQWPLNNLNKAAVLYWLIEFARIGFRMCS